MASAISMTEACHVRSVHGSTRRRRSRVADQARPVLERRVRARPGRHRSPRRPHAWLGPRPTIGPAAGHEPPPVPAVVDGCGGRLARARRVLEGAAARRPARRPPSGSFSRPARGVVRSRRRAEHRRRDGDDPRRADPSARLRARARRSRTSGAGSRSKNCGEAEQRDCFGVDHWMEELFVRSDTAHGRAVRGADRRRRRSVVDRGDGTRAARSRRSCAATVVCCCKATRSRTSAASRPRSTGWTRCTPSHPIAAWKVYTHAPGPGWSFVDDTGQAFLATRRGRSRRRAARASSRCTRGCRAATRRPRRPTSAPPPWRTPICNFVVYHSGYERRTREGPFAEDGKGVDRLVRSLRDAGVGPGGNVYAELGSTWQAVMGDPDQAAHVLGKLLAAVGEDNILWGTDSIWYGSPQDQIQAFRTFEITRRGAGAVRLPRVDAGGEGEDLRRQRGAAVRHRPGERRCGKVPVLARRPRAGSAGDRARQHDLRPGQCRRRRRDVPARPSVDDVTGSGQREERGEQRGRGSWLHLPVAISSRAECIDSCGAPTSTVAMPRRAAVIGPIVDPHGRSLRWT